jgi:hypothetical protein
MTMSERIRISPSRILTYLRCGEQDRRRNVEKEIIPPGVAQLKGTGLHKASEINFRQKIVTRQDLPKKQIIEAAIDTFNEKIAVDGLELSEEEKSVGKEKVVAQAHTSLKTLSTLYADNVAPRYQPKDVEEKIVVPIPNSNIDLVGVVDVIDESDVIVDIKTSQRKKPQDDADGSLQLTSYALTHWAKTGAPAVELRIENIIDSTSPGVQTLQTQRKEEDFASFLRIVETVAKGIEAGVFPPAYGMPGAWYCSPRFCGYWSTCPYVPKSRRNEK